jgi:hypothetical protein
LLRLAKPFQFRVGEVEEWAVKGKNRKEEKKTQLKTEEKKTKAHWPGTANRKPDLDVNQTLPRRN